MLYNEMVFGALVVVIALSLYLAERMGHCTLVALVVLYSVIANLFVCKTIALFGFVATASDAYAVGISVGYNMIQEGSGARAARIALYSALLISICFIAISMLHLLFVPAPSDWAQPHFLALLMPQPRILFASLFTYYIVQNVDITLFGKIKRQFPTLPFGLRSGLSTGIVQLVDTIMFSILGLWGIVSPLTSVIIISWGIKMCVIVLGIPLLGFIRTHFGNAARGKQL